MTRRANMNLRCQACKMHKSLCVCDLIVPMDTRTRLLLIIHKKEARKPTNTGLLARLCLRNSDVLVRGHVDRPNDCVTFAEDAFPVLLFPHEDAVELSTLVPDGRPVTLVVPDGTWRQASKMRSRVPGLRDLPCATLPRGDASRYRLRAEAHPHGLSTLEAIARAIYILEGPDAPRALEHVFRTMVERTLWARGIGTDEDVTSGIPEGAMRHDPESGLARRQ